MDAIKTYFVDVLKNHYCDFKGRATRTQYWLFVLFTIVLLLPINLILLFTIPKLMSLLNLALFIPNLAIITRRLRDGGFSPWWLLIGLLPVLGWLVLIVLYLMPSK